MKNNTYMIPVGRADETTVKALIELGVLYIGSDNKIHVVEK